MINDEVIMKCGLRGQQVCKEQGKPSPHISSPLCVTNMDGNGVTDLTEPGWPEDLEDDRDFAAISSIII